MSEFGNLEDAFNYVRILQKPILIPEIKPHKIWKRKIRERVDGGTPIRTPIDRVAARVVSPAPWWAIPPDINKKEELKPKIKKTKKKKKREKVKEIKRTVKKRKEKKRKEKAKKREREEKRKRRKEREKKRKEG